MTAELIPNVCRCTEGPFMPEQSAGILMYRRRGSAVEVLLVHPGGPFWKKKDDGAWTIPKGLRGEDEEALAAARREFEEETGAAPAGEFIPLGEFRQSSAKTVSVWAVEGDFDVTKLKGNTFTLEWPPRSGRSQEFPEIDRAAWFSPDEARRKILKGQRPALDVLIATLGSPRAAKV
jgi:predicted NUDIX family NTP pyrophosphohydrolase